MDIVGNLPFLVAHGVGIISIVASVITIVYLLHLNSRIGGKISTALSFFVGGIAINAIAIVWTAFIGHYMTIDGFQFDVHDSLMGIGMIFYILSAHQFSKLISAS